MYEELKTNYQAPHLQWPDAQNGVNAELSGTGGSVEIPVLNDNMLAVGKTGSGKTSFVKAYVKQHLMYSEDTLTVFFEIKPDDYSEMFKRRGDKIIHSHDPAGAYADSFKWNLIRELRMSKDKEAVLKQLSGVLFEDLEENPTQRIWAQAAKEVFQGFLRTVLYCYSNNLSNQELIYGMKTMSVTKLFDFIGKYPPNRSFLLRYFNYDSENRNLQEATENHSEYTLSRFGSDTMVFFQNVLERFYGPFLSDDGEDTLAEFFAGKYGTRLFLTYDYAKKEALSLFVRFFLKLMIMEKLSIDSDYSKKRLLLVLDEIPELEHDFGLMQGATLGRGQGLQIILSTQSIEKLYTMVPESSHSLAEHYINAMLSGFPTLVSFQPGDPKTIKTFQMFFGNRTRQTLVMPMTRYMKPEILTDTESPLVRYEDFASLKTGECYIKIRNAEPERIRIKI